MTPSPSMIAMYEEEAQEAVKKDGGADVSSPFYYLAGPMSNYPKFNFPAFHAAAKALRDEGYNICNPAEFDHEIERAVRESSSGSHKELTAELSMAGIQAPTWAECLRRDIEYVSHANCAGVIAMEGWENSQGAQFETYVNYKFLRPLYRLTMYNGNPEIEEIDRRSALNAAGVED